jgi:hypothetical protein
VEPFIIQADQASKQYEWVGAIVTQEVRQDGRRLFTKGQRLTPDDAEALASLARPIHAVRLTEDEVHEDLAGRRLAEAIAGENLELRGPTQSRYNLAATIKGLLRVDAAGVVAANLLPGIAVFTMQDRLVVLPGKVVTGTKVAPVAVPESVLEAVEEQTRGKPLVRVLPFLPLTVGVVTTEQLEGRARDRFQTTVEHKLDWFSAKLLRLEIVANDDAVVAGVIEAMIADGADVVLTAGGNTIDPIDPTFLALARVGAEIVRFGAPTHPGSMFWLAYRGAIPVFNLASCSMYSKSTVADLVLPWIMTGEVVGNQQLAELGYGGLLDRGMDFRFPPYDATRAEPEDDH